MSAQIVPFPGVRRDASSKSPFSEINPQLYPADLVVDQARRLLAAELHVLHTAPRHMQAEAAGSALLLASRMLLELSMCLQSDNVHVHWPMQRKVRS